MDTPIKTPKPRGFAALCQTPEGRARVSEIARRGGKAAHEAGTAHEFSSDEAREAGRQGGKVTHARRREAGLEKPADVKKLPTIPTPASDDSSLKVAE